MTATAVGGMHPTGMHPCFICVVAIARFRFSCIEKLEQFRMDSAHIITIKIPIPIMGENEPLTFLSKEVYCRIIAQQS